MMDGTVTVRARRKGRSCGKRFDPGDIIQLPAWAVPELVDAGLVERYGRPRLTNDVPTGAIELIKLAPGS